MFAIFFQINLELTTPPPGIADALDECMAECAGKMHFDGRPTSLSDKTWAALTDCWPACGKDGALKLPSFQRARKAWARLAPGATRDGLPWFLLCLLLDFHLRMGHDEAAIAFLLMFICYLRPSELLSLRVADPVWPTRAVPHFAQQLHPRERG